MLNTKDTRDTNTLFSRFDTAFADFLQDKEPSSDPNHLVLASLVSHLYMKGHTCLDLSLLAARDWDALALDASVDKLIDKNLSQSAQTLRWTKGPSSPLVLDGHLLYLRKNWDAEQRIIDSIRRRLEIQCTEVSDLKKKLDELFVLDQNNSQSEPDWQRLACAVATKKMVTLITGGPGTGKTTTVTRLLSLLVTNSSEEHQPKKLRLALTAPTGKAAARLGASLGIIVRTLPEKYRFEITHKPVTLHKLLQLGTNDAESKIRELAYDVVVVDEASMISLHLMDRLLASTPLNTRLIFLGDQDQLASVEAGAVLGQLCLDAVKGNYSLTTIEWMRGISQQDMSVWAGDGSPLAQQTVMLRKSHRVEGGGVISQWAQMINSGSDEDLNGLKTSWNQLNPWSAQAASKFPPVDRLDLIKFKDNQAQLFLQNSWSRYLDLIKKNPLDTSKNEDYQHKLAKEILDAFSEFQVLCAVREGAWGVSTLNGVIAELLGFKSEGWYHGRPVMVTENNYHLDLRNGDIGICLQKNGVLRVAFPRDSLDDVGSKINVTATQSGSSSAPGPVKWVLPSRLDAVESVFAMTVHKSQGSEFNHVCLVLPPERSAVLTKELIYTGLTRAKKRVTWIVPNPSVLFKSIQTRLSRSGGLHALHDKEKR